MPEIGPMMMGECPPDWRVVLECRRTPAGNVAWSIDPDAARYMTDAQADKMAASLRSFLRKVANPTRRT